MVTVAKWTRIQLVIHQVPPNGWTEQMLGYHCHVDENPTCHPSTTLQNGLERMNGAGPTVELGRYLWTEGHAWVPSQEEWTASEVGNLGCYWPTMGKTEVAFLSRISSTLTWILSVFLFFSFVLGSKVARIPSAPTILGPILKLERPHARDFLCWTYSII